MGSLSASATTIEFAVTATTPLYGAIPIHVIEPRHDRQRPVPFPLRRRRHHRHGRFLALQELLQHHRRPLGLELRHVVRQLLGRPADLDAVAATAADGLRDEGEGQVRQALGTRGISHDCGMVKPPRRRSRLLTQSLLS